MASAVDHHGLNAGTVTLIDTTDKNVHRAGSVDATGAFTVDYVPAGTYTLEVTEGADTEPVKKKPGSQGLLGGMLQMASVHTVKSYEDARAVGDCGRDGCDGRERGAEGIEKSEEGLRHQRSSVGAEVLGF